MALARRLLRLLKKLVQLEIIDIAPGDHFVGDISQKETLEAFADHVLKKTSSGGCFGQ